MLWYQQGYLLDITSEFVLQAEKTIFLDGSMQNDIPESVSSQTTTARPFDIFQWHRASFRCRPLYEGFFLLKFSLLKIFSFS